MASMIMHGDIPVTETESSPHSVASAPKADETSHIYQAVLIIKNFQQRTPALEAPCPMTAADITLTSAENTSQIKLYNFQALTSAEDTISIDLFNLLVWSVGLSDDCVMTNIVEIDDDTNVTFISI